jgi:hypothetical protein
MTAPFFGPYDGLHIIMMSPAYAERWTRNCYNVPDDIRLGWKPYTILIQSYGGTAYEAFHSLDDLRQWMRGSFAVSGLRRYWRGCHCGRIAECAS